MAPALASAILALAVLSCCSLVTGGGGGGGRTIQGVWLKMPAVVRAGATVTLVCQFDMQGAPLYAVKWYRGNYEFFRYVPRERPPHHAFPRPGIEVDVSGSNVHQVTLRSVPLRLSGRFKCEVTADAPSFSTSSASANLTIIELGVRRPTVQVPSSVHRSKVDPLRVNCSAQQTQPPPKITFFIDDKRVSSEHVRDLGPGLAGLVLRPPPWEGERPRWVRCEAAVPGVYLLSSNGVAVLYREEEPHPASGEEPRTSGGVTSLGGCDRGRQGTRLVLSAIALCACASLVSLLLC